MGETEIQTQIDIDAPASVVWGVLTNFSGFHEWNPMVTSAEGSASEDSIATLRFRSNIGVPLHFRVRITRSQADRELRWVGSRFGISGEHYFQLSNDGDGTHFVHGEVFRGLLAKPLGFLFRDQLPVFEAFNEALRDVSEHRFRSAGAAPATGGTTPTRR
jgi:hypothetical protein